MISKHDILQMAKHIMRRDRGKLDRSLMHPDREWSLGMLIVGLCFIIGAWFAADAYLSTEQILENQETEVTSSAVLKQELIADALARYRERQQEYTSNRSLGVIATSEEFVETASSTEAGTNEDEESDESGETAAETNETDEIEVVAETATTSEEGE